MTRALLILVPREPAIFSRRAATEGVHETLPYPTGASLLGWAAADGRYDTFNDPFTVFHSGKVRFSDAVPLTAECYPAFRIPRLLVEAKHGKKAVEKGNPRLMSEHVWVGPTAFKADQAKTKDLQPEALKDGFVAADLGLAEFDTDSRLRTATEKGMAREGALFGYGHIEPVARKDREAILYVATIEAEGVLSNDDWKKLKDAFDGKELRLGRAGRTGYGGWYCCYWFDGNGTNDPWPTGKMKAGTKCVRVWVLSDLAILDERGVPCFAPEDPALIGLPPGGTLDRKESAIGTRRFAPWNGHLRKRDIERQVIEAGSVLTYTYGKGVPDDEPIRRTVGLFQEQGLGRLWINPPMLRGDKPAADPDSKSIKEAEEVKKKLTAEREKQQPVKAERNSLVGWARNMAALGDTGRRDAFLADLISDLQKIRGQIEDMPSPSQWAKAATAARRAADLAAIRHALFEGAGPACGRHDDTTREKDWRAKIRIRIGEADHREIRLWLKARIGEAEARNLRAAEVKWVLDQLAKHAADTRRKAREKANG